MEHPMFVRSCGAILLGSSSGILNLDPPVCHRLTPPLTFQPMSLFSDDDDDDAAEGGDGTCYDSRQPNGGGCRGWKGSSTSASPWQRMKWTDDVAQLLISLIASIVDDAGGCSPTVGNRRKPSAALQKKGKWKMVSKLMMKNGCYVSPQQCEYKFNDLNKRYKMLNEILGRGTSCQVVENPALLDSMPHISQKAKEDVRRILSSKHLFYREMCAYHNGQRMPNSHGIALHSSTRSKVGFFTERDAHELDDEDEEDEEEKEVDADGYDDGDGNDDARCDDFGNVGYDKVRSDTDVVLRETSKPCWVRRLWIQKQLLQLVQDRVGIQAEAFELEKQQVKWKRFCSKKDRELESLMLENESRRLENERMVIQVRQKEMELDLMKAGEIIQQRRAS